MPSALGCLRKYLLSPSIEEVGFARRGFPSADMVGTHRLDKVSRTVVCGFEWGVEFGDDECVHRLEMIEPSLRGFACEGTTMAYVIRDAMRNSGRTRRFLLGPGYPQLFPSYIGVGFALARLPRALWQRAVPDLTGSPYHPTMSWLAVDGYGFDRAFFDTRRWIKRQRVPRPYPWLDAPGYFHRAVDQGIGRALWFIHGGHEEEVASAVRDFAEARHADLWSGVGLAAAYAGGSDGTDLNQLCITAGRHRGQLGVGAIFAAKAHSHAGYVPEHTRTATTALTSLSVPEAVRLADSTETHDAESAEIPAYESWRRRIRSQLVHEHET
ncbi:Protein of unknown function [Actinopolyspora mzabensis]|uniref:Enediyne biosynthesis protein n=1 Tax=Actinopolyspora mzabensis TaxID=995066 RepID=A0A1G8Y3M2_ACTMZ|nr:DUF1702 family protein [Actinopolyspora mzabensis]SDJ97263.1 Protein of unknown function [Actinopolyspora mzabensis]